ncbi:MAG: hypothetical protein ACTSRA_16160, partial [Promethearchaeota archaeon]
KPLRFQFWVNLSNIDELNQSGRLDQLERHGAILTVYGLVGFEPSPENNKTFEIAAWIRDNYPNIKLIWPVFGSYYHWKEMSEGIDYYLEMITAYNLTNTFGFNWDTERHNDTCAHDAYLLEMHRESIMESITKVKAFNSSYRIDNTAGIWMMFDNLSMGGSFELYKQHAMMSIPWETYGWQLYRGNAVDLASDPESADIYDRILSSINYVGANRTIPYFGMTGVGDYGPNNCTVESGVGSCNFAGVIKDCRICRALGVEEVCFFTLSNAGVIDIEGYGGCYYPSMWEAYGEDFLDVLNESVNGLDEPLELIIPENTAFDTTVGYWWPDVIISIPILFVVILLSSATFVSTVIDKSIIKKIFKTVNDRRKIASSG